MRIGCGFCRGTGVADVIYHQDEDGNAGEEWVRCNACEGLGYQEVPDNEAEKEAQ